MFASLNFPSSAPPEKATLKSDITSRYARQKEEAAAKKKARKRCKSDIKGE